MTTAMAFSIHKANALSRAVWATVRRRMAVSATL
ncbi:hypothetical protein SAMN05428984_0072 [Sphingomonas sp. OK281]|nr:hypothetical protein SAMN05428984_0072 [Sphingomonas sp. OK281]